MTEPIDGSRSWSSRRAGMDLQVTLIEHDSAVAPAVAMLREQQVIAVDFETTTFSGEYGDDYGPHAGDIRLIQVGYVDPRDGVPRQLIFDGHKVDLSPLKELLEDPAVGKVVHYCPFELAWARHHLNSDIVSLADTCFAAQSVYKEMRMRVAEAISPRASRPELLELAANLSRPGEDGTVKLPDGSSLRPERLRAAVGQVVGRLTYELRSGGHPDLALRLSDWQPSERSRLKDLNLRYRGVEMSKEEQASDWSRELSREQLDYAAADAAITLELARDMQVLCEVLGVGKRVSFRIRKEREELASA